MLSLTANLLYNILMILLFELKAQLGSFLLLLNSCFLKIYTKFYLKHIFVIFTMFMATFIIFIEINGCNYKCTL